MNARHSVSAALVLALVSSVSAFGQTSAPAQPRFYVAAIGGAVSRPAAEPLFGGEIAQDVARHGQAYLTVNYFENLMGESLRDALDAKAAQLSTLTGSTWSFAGRDRAVAVVAGGRYAFGNGAIRPYVGTGLGTIHLKRTVVEAQVGDVTRAVFNDYQLGEADLSLATEGITRPLVEAAFGVGIGGRRTYFDVAYRYRRAFHMTTTLDFSQVTAGIGYRF